ncbi:hypothetical protein WT01_11045 [Burkholderia cepacia]|nr:hypothetical protein WT01_11045 [Burkholderia cepacia]
MPKLPLIIMVVEAEQDIYAKWRHRAVIIGALVATFGAAFVMLCIMLGARLRFSSTSTASRHTTITTGIRPETKLLPLLHGNIRRPVDTAARYGGEEFVVLLPDTPQTGAAEIAERIRTAINGLELERVGSEYGYVTASIGLASWTPDQDGAPGSVIKATGRNKVTAFNPSA